MVRVCSSHLLSHCILICWLSNIFAPDIDSEVFPPFVTIKSVHNTIIEGFWCWLKLKLGLSIKDQVLRGKLEHIFDPNVQYHT